MPPEYWTRQKPGAMEIYPSPFLPQVPILLKTSGIAYYHEQNALYHAASSLGSNGQVTSASRVREDIKVLVEFYSKSSEGWQNNLSGGLIREEDSPGNYVLRENGPDLEFVAYDAAGAPHVLERARIKGADQPKTSAPR